MYLIGCRPVPKAGDCQWIVEILGLSDVSLGYLDRYRLDDEP